MKKRSYIYLGIGSFIVTLALFLSLIAPVWNRNSGLDILTDFIYGDKEGNIVGDDTGWYSPGVTLLIYDNFTMPENSFGINSTKDINITFYRDWLNSTIQWSLQKSNDNISWIDCTKLLTVDKVWNPTDLTEKHTLSWVSDEDAWYQLSLKTDDVKSYQDLSSISKDKEDKILLNFSITNSEDYNVFYDWSDYSKSVEASKTRMSKSVDVVGNKNVFSWSVFTNVKLVKGEKFSIDPTFGYSGTGSEVGVLNYIVGSYAAPSSGGTADSISVYIRESSGASSFKAKCALYNYVDYSSSYAGTLVASTEEKIVSYSATPVLYTFNFSEPKPEVLSGTNYYIMVWAGVNSGSPTAAISYVTGSTGMHSALSYTGTFPSPLTSEVARTRNYAIYCSYTEAGSWKITSNTINGSIYNSSSWKITSNTINGSIYNVSFVSWTITSNTINGSIYNSSSWTITSNTINGSIYNNTGIWAITSNTINGSIYNVSVDEWTITSNTINGSIFNSSSWTITSNIINGSIYNNTGSWIITSNTINGSIYNSSSWKITSNTINGSIYNVSFVSWTITSNTINGSIYNSSSWTITSNTINGSIYNNTGIWAITSNTINGSIYNVSVDEWTITSNTINGSIYNSSSWTITSNTINGSIYNASKADVDIINEYPSNLSIITILQPTIFFTIIDSDGSSNYSIYVGNSSANTTILVCNVTGVGNGTYNCEYFTAVDYHTAYYWRIVVEDIITIQEILHFTIRSNDAYMLPSPLYGVIGLVGLLGVIGYILRRRRR